jgi:hypothetical protein
MHLLDEVAEHLLADLEIRDDAVLERPDGLDVAGRPPDHPLCLGAWLGATTRKTATIVPLLFGLAMPLFIDSGALEPTRFDGETVWWASHATPLYYVVGWFQWAFFGLRITPEPPWVNLVITLGIALAAFALAQRRISTLRLERAR